MIIADLRHAYCCSTHSDAEEIHVAKTAVIAMVSIVTERQGHVYTNSQNMEEWCKANEDFIWSEEGIAVE